MLLPDPFRQTITVLLREFDEAGSADLRFPGAPSAPRAAAERIWSAPGAHRSLRRSAAERSGRRDMVNPRSGRLGREISGLNPGYGAWAMATGIMSTGLALYGEHAPSEVLLAIACAAFALLLVAYRGTGSRCRISNGYELLCLVTPLV